MSYIAGLFAVLVAIAIFIPETSEARSYNGSYESTDGMFVAKIKDNQISMDLVTPDMRGLYWKGSFKSKTNRIVSKADTKALEYAIFGSMDKEKLFVYRAGRLHFHFRMQDVSKVITLRRTA